MGNDLQHIVEIQYIQDITVCLNDVFSRHLTPVVALNKRLKKGGDAKQKMFTVNNDSYTLKVQYIALYESPFTHKYHRYILMFTNLL